MKSRLEGESSFEGDLSFDGERRGVAGGVVNLSIFFSSPSPSISVPICD